MIDKHTPHHQLTHHRLIMTNKYIMSEYHFGFVFTLTSCHFIAQLCLLESLALMGAFEVKRMPLLDNLKASLAMVMKIAFVLSF